MIVSWNWLTEYVDLEMSHDDLVDRLTMSGLNHEGTEEVDGDKAIDLEVKTLVDRAHQIALTILTKGGFGGL